MARRLVMARENGQGLLLWAELEEGALRYIQLGHVRKGRRQRGQVRGRGSNGDGMDGMDAMGEMRPAGCSTSRQHGILELRAYASNRGKLQDEM
ncbi:uncharacterized protein SPSK_10139 [Sporothrix schenckii 1099-18]|uniref:Uncharacterized protein n=1 Tax=Sporothrix schenckii 1099-18 TaxID=1397361 RepID=A0A0F2M5J7_SPOSC|nr:uncharacterized protein SPSK_10139 [Sporothrix schenckii 1099-18]KJR84963.1 hypothetical protein SPSK_10139 [Sporothrix schenckii 1099-18]